MSGTLNRISTNVQCYGLSETSTIPCFRVSGKPGSIYSGAGSVFKPCQVEIINAKLSSKRTSFVCKAVPNNQRRNPDFPPNRNIYTQNSNRYNEERDNSENSHRGESEFVSTKNGPILSLSNSPQSNSTFTLGQKEKEIVELFRKIQAKLGERSTMKEEKKFDTVIGQSKESESTDFPLDLLRKHSSGERSTMKEEKKFDTVIGQSKESESTDFLRDFLRKPSSGERSTMKEEKKFDTVIGQSKESESTDFLRDFLRKPSSGERSTMKEEKKFDTVIGQSKESESADFPLDLWRKHSSGERSTMKEEKKFDTVIGQSKESESGDSLLDFLREHSSEQGQRKINGENTSEFRVDHPSKVNGWKSYGDESRSVSNSSRVVKEVPEETPKPSFDRPVSNFRRRSPVPKVIFEPIVFTELTHDSVVQPDLDVNTNGSYYEPVPDFESESELESHVDPIGSVGEGDEKDAEKHYHEVKDLNSMNLVELRALAKSRGMKGFSKLKKSELIGLLSDDSGLP